MLIDCLFFVPSSYDWIIVAFLDKLQLSDVLGMDTAGGVLLTSAKTGKGLGDVLPAVIE